MAEVGLVLSFDEIRILLFGLGVTQIEGILLPETPMEREAAIRAMHHLTKRQILKADETAFCVREDVREMLMIMAAPEASFVWKPEGGDGPWYYCYRAGERVVVSEQCAQKRDAVRLQLWNLLDFLEWKEKTEDDNRGDYSAGDGEEV